MQIQRLIKGTAYFIATCLIGVIGFYYWASSAKYPEEDYSKLIVNNYTQQLDKDSIYSIITYNIGYLSGMTNNLPVAKTKDLFDANLIRVYREFEKIDADLICFQEIDYGSKRSYYVNQQNELQQLGYNYIFQAVNWDINYLPFPYFPPSAHHGRVFSGQSIFSKHLLIDNERIVLDRVEDSPFYREAFYLERLAQVSKTILEGKTIVVINVHLEAFDQPTRINHAKQIIKLYNRYQDKYPVLLVGDFNSDKEFDNAVIKSIFSLPGIKSAVPSREKTYPSSMPNARLDYIFYNEAFIELSSAGIITSAGESSDHLPIMMEFRLK